MVVGGLGLGYTVQRLLADPRVERVAVVEVEDALIGWMRDGTVPHGPALLADQRVKVVVADIAVAVAEARPDAYDLVLLDVDNGPDYLVHAANAALYDQPFLQLVRAVLRPGGALAVWSASDSPALRTAMEAVFPTVRAEALDVRLQDRDEQYWLYLGS